jgi:hypothetical protein
VVTHLGIHSTKNPSNNYLLSNRQTNMTKAIEITKLIRQSSSQQLASHGFTISRRGRTKYDLRYREKHRAKLLAYHREYYRKGKGQTR